MSRVAWLARGALPFAAGLALALVLGAGGFVLLSTLRPAPAGDKLTARLIGRLDPMLTARTVVTLDGDRDVPAVCTTGPRSDDIRVGKHVRLRMAGIHVRRVGGPHHPALTAAEAMLSACPRFLMGRLRLHLNERKRTWLASTYVAGRPVYVFRVSERRPFVELLTTRRNLVPIAMRFVSRHLSGYSDIVAMSRRRFHAGWPPHDRS